VKVEKYRLQQALKDRNIVATWDQENVQENPYSPSLDASGPTLIMAFPVFMLYPQYATSDLISEFSENSTFSSHISVIFPPNGHRPPWDADGAYITGNSVVYAMTRQRRLFKVGKRMSLKDVFVASAGEGHEDGLEMKNGCLTFALLAKGGVEEKWVQEYKANRDDSII